MARRSPNALYDPALAGFGESGGLFSQQASPGFIELWSLQSRMAYNVRNRERETHEDQGLHRARLGTWQGIKTVVRRKLGTNKVKLGAAATVARRAGGRAGRGEGRDDDSSGGRSPGCAQTAWAPGARQHGSRQASSARRLRMAVRPAARAWGQKLATSRPYSATNTALPAP